MVRTETEDKLAAVEEVLSNRLSMDDAAPQLELPKLRDKVDSIIHEWFTDMWLLISGEEMEDESSFEIEKDGHALAMICGGQMRLLGSKVSALHKLRSVGVEMS